MNFANRSGRKESEAEAEAVNGNQHPASRASDTSSDSNSRSGSESDSGAPSSSSDDGYQSDTLEIPAAHHQPANTADDHNIFAPVSPNTRPELKRKHSDPSTSSSSSGSESESDDSDTKSLIKRIKRNHPTEARSSTVATRNPLPPEFTNDTIKPRSASAQLDHLLISEEETKPTFNNIAIRYPKAVLAASKSLEAVLPPYLIRDSNVTTERRDTHEAMRPPAGSNDTDRLVKLFESARKLIMHLSIKKISEGESDMQGQMLRIAKEREQHLRVMESEVKRLLAKNSRN